MHKRKKVLHVLHAVGGVDIYLRIVTKAIDTTKFEMVIVHGFEDTDKIYTDKNGILIREYKIPIVRDISPANDLRSIIQLIKLIKKEKPDVIHAHSAKGGIIARTAAFLLGIKVFYTPHAFSYLSAENKLKKKLFLWIEKTFRLPKAFVLATSLSEAKRAIEEVNFKKEKVIIFENSIFPISEEQKNKSLVYKLPERFISSVGRPSYQKNIEAMVEVFRLVNEKLPELKLVLMGVGFYAPNVEKVNELLRKYNLEDKFIMLPWISQEEIFTIIDKSELYISTARYEGLPYSVIESLALGKACVVSDCDGNRDLVQNNQNGFVIDQNKLVDEMPEAILKILFDKDLKSKFESKSLKYFNEKHNILNSIKDLERIYLD